MKQYLGMGIGIAVGTIIGAAGVTGLYAQSKAPIFLVTEIDVTNPQAYEAFAKKAQVTIRDAGGRLVALGGIGGAGAKPVTALEGTPPKRLVIQAWDSLDQLMGWYKGSAYQSALKEGEKAATFRRFAVEGTER
jgi:uncharacterized protein (DUF1330 family)